MLALYTFVFILAPGPGFVAQRSAHSMLMDSNGQVTSVIESGPHRNLDKVH